MKPSQYLLEVGCEELPAGFIQAALEELPLRLEKLLREERLDYQQCKVMMTPRRIVLLIKGLSHKQAQMKTLIKGPPLKVAQDAQGNWTPAAQGFATKVGTSLENLKQQEIDGVTYLTYLAQDDGQPVETVLARCLPDLILGLPGSHFMRWQQGSKVVFSRPIHWVVSLMDNTVVPLEIAAVKASNQTRGHRFLADNAWLEIPGADLYETTLLEKGHVVVDPEKRKNSIQAQLQSLSAEKNMDVIEDEALLEHVIHLVESPKVLMGDFDASYLKLPAKVIQTVMSSHQKYFALQQKNSENMAPHFVTIANNLTLENQPIIQSGNEKVLKARLEDASFFFDEDSRQKLEAYVENLKGISFQKNMGSLFDKTQRLVALAPKVAEVLGHNRAVIADAQRAALLSKADLATQLVRELTELQGFVGEVYAKNSGESSAVCQAVKNYYLPRYAGDAVAQDDVSIAVSIADKVDTLVAAFSQKNAKLPSGSKDPMGLRRLSLGLIRTLVENNLALNLTQLFETAYEGLGALATQEKTESLSLLKEFMAQRLSSYLEYPSDIIDAVTEVMDPLGHLSAFEKQLALLQQLKDESPYAQTFYQLVEPANRIAKILGKQALSTASLEAIDPSLLENDEEKALLETAKQVIPEFAAEPELLKRFNTLKKLQLPVQQFFDKTLVNSENPAVKANRYQLLSVLNVAYRELADLTKLILVDAPMAVER